MQLDLFSYSDREWASTVCFTVLYSSDSQSPCVTREKHVTKPLVISFVPQNTFEFQEDEDVDDDDLHHLPSLHPISRQLASLHSQTLTTNPHQLEDELQNDRDQGNPKTLNPPSRFPQLRIEISQTLVSIVTGGS